MNGSAGSPTDTELAQVRVRMLDPNQVRFERMPLGGLQMTDADGTVYDHVLVYRAFPLSRPGEYISVRRGRSELEQKEIGMIRRLEDLAADQRAEVESDLEKRYFVHTVLRIVSIREDMGYFYWVVETDKGLREFPVPIRPRYITYLPPRGRLVMDIDGNRYGIPDLPSLDARSQALFHKHIYW